MHKGIFFQALRSRMNSVLVWSGAQVALILTFFSIFPSFSEQAEVMNQMLERFPPELMAAFGMSRLDLSSLLGYYSLIFVFCQLCFAIQAANYGFSLLSAEENERTADFLLSKPVSRNKVLTSKLVAAIVSLTITNVVVWLCSFFCLHVFSAGKGYNPKTIFLLLGSIIIFQLIFFSVGLLISLWIKRIRTVTPYALGLAFGTYLLNAFSGVFQDVKLELITPFKHFDPAYIVEQSRLNVTFVLIDIILIAISIMASYWFFKKRDIPAAT